MGESPPARAAQQGRAAPTPRVGHPGRVPGGRPARRARAARFLEPVVRPRAGAWVRAVRQPQEAREPVPAEPPVALRMAEAPASAALRMAEAPAPAAVRAGE